MSLLACSLVAPLSWLGCSSDSSSDDATSGATGGTSGTPENRIVGVWSTADGFCGSHGTKQSGLVFRADGTLADIGLPDGDAVDAPYCIRTGAYHLEGTYSFSGDDLTGTVTYYDSSATVDTTETFAGKFVLQCGDTCSAQATFGGESRWTNIMMNEGGRWCQTPQRTLTGECAGD